jgi:hypothetical protein
LFLQWRHPLPQLGEGQQSLLVSRHQPFAALPHASLFPAQFLFASTQRVRLLRGLAAAINFGLD